MPRWAVIFIGASAALVLCIFAFVAFRNQEIRHAEATTAERRFKALNAANSEVNAIQARFDSDYKKMTVDYTAAIDAGNKRHDDFYSLSTETLLDLARTERTKVESLQTLQEDVEVLDQSYLKVLASAYGEGAVVTLRQAMAQRNEARENSFNLWWSAARGNEDDFKAELNGASDANSNDTIAHDYEEDARDETHAKQLQLEVDRMSLVLEHRLSADWRRSKQTVATLQGSR